MYIYRLHMHGYICTYKYRYKDLNKNLDWDKFVNIMIFGLSNKYKS